MRLALTTFTLAFAFILSVTGCERPEDPMLKILESTVTQARVDDLSRTMDYVFSERQSDQTQFNNSVSQGLNRWAGYSKEQFDKVEWKADSSIEDILKPYSEGIPVVERMDSSSFLASDSQYLQSLAWMDFIANRVKDKAYIGQYELYRLMADDYQAEEDEEAPVLSRRWGLLVRAPNALPGSY